MCNSRKTEDLLGLTASGKLEFEGKKMHVERPNAEYLAIRMNERNSILYLLVAEPHLPPRISRDIHTAQKDSLLVTIVQNGG